MDVRAVYLAAVVLAVSLSGCATTGSSSHRHDNSVSISPLIGLFGMAVDGDDKDDYEKFFDDDGCKCHKH